jgi:peptidoglycan/xylan/chitin deacetylase (PgdA/CDA1 family)
MQIIFIFSIFWMIVVIPSSSIDNFKAMALTAKTHACECVIFRFDDVRNGYLEDIQLALMDFFITKDESVSLGLIMDQIENGSSLYQKIDEGYKKGLFELAVHGWDHIDYTTLGQKEQKTSLLKADEKMLSLFGNHSRVFIPPFNLFDNNTISAIKNLNFKVLSSAIYYDEPQVMKTNKDLGLMNSKIIHMPEMTDFSIFYNNTWVKVPIRFILADIDFDIKTYGYSVVMVHPHNFAIYSNGTLLDMIDQNQIRSLSNIMDILNHKNFKIATFSSVVK